MERTGNITFSVIVPVYNVQAYLSACVKSVVEQAGPADWECILVDDGSTDACPAMCDAFAQLCPGVTVIHRSNGGLAAARNTGIKAAKGKWLLFLDSDDYWPPHMLEKLRAALAAAPGYRWYVCRYLEQDESQGMDAKPYPGPVERFTPGPDADPDYAARVARLYAAGHWAVWRFCIDREFLVKYNLLFWNEVRWAEDYPFDLVLAGACPKLYYLDVELVVYRANRAGSLLNAGLAKHFAGIAAVIHRFEKMFAAPDCPWTPTEQAEIWRRTAAGPRRCLPGCRGTRRLCPRPDRLQSTLETGGREHPPGLEAVCLPPQPLRPPLCPLGGRAAETEIKLCTHCRGRRPRCPMNPCRKCRFRLHAP